MRYAHLHQQIYCQPWFITTSAYETICTLFERHLTGVALDLGGIVNQRQPMAIDSDGIASIHVLGPIAKNLSQMERQCGATSFEQLREDYAQAQAQGARGILLNVNSPGGTVNGTPEMADLIASRPLPTVAYTEDSMASAAYYLAAGAEQIIATPSSSVGSIGVLLPWVDKSQAIAARGLKPEPITNTGGDLKGIGFTGSLTAAQREFLQSQADEMFAEFKTHVLEHRVIPAEAMRGQSLTGRAALAANLIDHLGDLAIAKSTLRELIA